MAFVVYIHQNKSNKKIYCPPPATGRVYTPEMRQHLSEAISGDKHFNFGKKASKETRDKMSESAKGREFSQEVRDKISVSEKATKRAKKALNG